MEPAPDDEGLKDPPFMGYLSDILSIMWMRIMTRPEMPVTFCFKDRILYALLFDIKNRVSGGRIRVKWWLSRPHPTPRNIGRIRKLREEGVKSIGRTRCIAQSGGRPLLGEHLPNSR